MPDASGAGLTIAVALVAGMLAQSIASHLSIPGIVLLLFVGAILGPELAGWVNPDTLGAALPTLVGFAVAVVLFEGGMNLDIAKIRRERRAIRMLISVGALVTIIGATLTARFVLAWDWRVAGLFGTLVVVTGPTVVTPLLKRVRIDSKVATVLEAEAVFGDAVGAVIAVAAYELATLPIDPQSVTQGALEVLARLGVGGLFGGVAGIVLVVLLRSERVVERGLENVFTLSAVLAIFQVSNSILHESGIAAVIAAGMVVGNVKTRVYRELHAFKEGLTVMFIGLLFVLLAADVELGRMLALGAAGLLTVAILMLVVRPSAVFLATIGSGMPLRHRLFVSWLAPRGIIAASIASLFAVGLGDTDMVGAAALREMVFLVIFVTVCSAGFTGGLAARLLRLERPTATGWIVLGASAIARAMAQQLRDAGQDVVCIDTNPKAARAAEEAGLRIIYGNGLEELTLRRAGVQARAGFLALTANEEVNLLFAQRIRQYNKRAPIFVALDALNEGVTASMAHHAGARVLFGGAYRAARWEQLFERNAVKIAAWRVTKVNNSDNTPLLDPAHISDGDLYLPLLIKRGTRMNPVGDAQMIAGGDHLVLAINQERLSEAVERLRERGWVEAEPPVSEA